MLKFSAADFFTVTSNLTELRGISKYADQNAARPIEDASRVYVTNLSDKMFTHLNTINAPFTARQTIRLKVSMDDPNTSWEKFAAMIDDLERRLHDELDEKWLLALSDQEVAWFEPKEPLFGQEFASKFSTRGAFELDEAAKCLALGRSTATVFHLMRMMELGIRAMCTCLAVPDPVKPAERNWAIILGKIRDEGIRKKWPTAAERMAGDAALFEELYASLDAVKSPWRDPTMHVEKKYTTDEAVHIYVAVNVFMRKLASRCDENGEPKA